MTTVAPVAGWYPDPLTSSGHRYWDGTAWTEHTSDQAAAIPAPAVPVEAVVAQQPALPETPAAAYAAHPGHHDPYGGDAFSADPVNANPVSAGSVTPDPYTADPYRVAPRPPMRPTNDWRFRRPPGPSTATKVLVGLAIAFGVIVVLGILAAIAIPVFLNERAKEQAAATTVSMPASALGWVRADTADARQFAQQFASMPAPGIKSVGVYATPAGQPRAVIVTIQTRFSAADQAEYLRSTRQTESQSGVTGFHSVEPGPLGGVMECGYISGASATICNFADAGVAGTINILGTTTGDAKAVQLREAVEHRR